MPDDITAQVEDGERQQIFLDEKERVQHPPRAPVAIGKRVNRFELIMRRRHPDQGVELGGFMQKPLPVRQERAEPVLAFRRRIDHLTASFAGERSARHATHGHRPA